jgi:DNA (cytosine-5)-methyltransferase 1
VPSGKHRAFLDEVVLEFEAAGYEIRKPWSVLNAANYGVPQNRERLILLGARKGNKVPLYPPPSPERPTCEDALDDLPNADDFQVLLDSDEINLPANAWKWPSKYAREMRCLSNDAWHYGYIRMWDPRMLTSSMRTGHTEISRRRFERTQGGETEPISRFFKLLASGVSNTLRAGTDSARGAFTSPRPIHYRYPRCVTVREMARLHGFPDWFRFHATKWHGGRQVGNSVPPPLARAIGAELISALNLNPSLPKVSIQLGDPGLLTRDMSGAAAYWKIEVPIGRRDRKSGAKKRKQYEIEQLSQ